MPPRVIFREPREELGTSIAKGIAGFQQGRELRRRLEAEQAQRELEQRRFSLAEAKTLAEIDKLTREGFGTLTPSQQISRARFQQQFGVDPITGEEIPEDQLYDPRFGFGSGDELFFTQAQEALKRQRTGEDQTIPKSKPSSIGNLSRFLGFQRRPQQTVPRAAPSLDIPAAAEDSPRFLSQRELSRQGVIRQLEAQGFPVTEANIQAALQQLERQRY